MASESSSGPYLGYLRTEMTIMGVLSAFTAATGAVVTEKLLAAEKDTLLSFLWRPAQTFWLLGLAAWLGSSLLFYRQRSHLAYLYGQLALTEAKEQPSYLPSQGDVLVRCDSWETWIYYRQGFMALMIAAMFYGGATWIAVAPQSDQPIRSCWLTVAAWIIVPALVVFAGVQQYVFTKFAENEYPWEDFARELRSRSERSHN